MDKRRTAIRAVAVLAVAFAAGHLVQTMNKGGDQLAAAEPVPTQIEPVAAGPEPLALPAPVAPQVQTAALTDVAPPAAAPLLPQPPVVVTTPAPALTPAPVVTAPPAETADCTVRFDLLAQPQAMLGLTLLAPCNTNERVVLRHAGLAVTAQTTATGSLFLSLPALESEAKVSVMFADLSTVDASLTVPDLAGLRRFGVQWGNDDAFQLHAFEGGAGFGQPGHIWAEEMGFSLDGAPLRGGFLIGLGDDAVDQPMLAEVYTYPANPETEVEIVVEAAVTEATCARELMGETIASVAGTITVTDLTVATPDCDGVGDIVVLKNLVPDMKIAAN